MPKFSVGFGRRKPSAADEELQNAPTSGGPSFRVLTRTEVGTGKTFDGGARMAKTTTLPIHRPSLSQTSVEDNMFAGLANRGSGSSNTTKTTSTDTSSRHSQVSTAPSSADITHQQGTQEEWKASTKTPRGKMTDPASPKPPSRGFLERAGRTFSFGQRKHPPPVVPSVADHPLPSTPSTARTSTLDGDLASRPRGLTSSTSSTATPPKLDAQNDFSMDMGSDFGQMFDGKFKRNSVMTLKALPREGSAPNEPTGPPSQPGTRQTHLAPTPIHIDHAANVEPSPHSWSSQHSNDRLLNARSNPSSPPPVPRHASPLSFTPSRRPSDIVEDEDVNLLKDSLAASQLLGGSEHPEKPATEITPSSSSSEKRPTDDNIFEGGLAQSSRIANRFVSRAPSPPRNKVMTPAQFERYRQDIERKGSATDTGDPSTDGQNDEEDDYDDDDDEMEKAKQAAKQRRKQEAHMTIYRQQMMKVTGESSSSLPSSRPSLQASMSSPTLLALPGQPGTAPPLKAEDDGDEDEEIPLAILAAHGFPNKNKPPNRLSTMGSHPDLRASMLLQPPNRPTSGMGNTAASQAGNRASQLPAFARRLPQDPFLGAGLVNGPPRESMNLSGGLTLPQAQGVLPPGGLVGVIASEERSRAMRRGSPQVDAHHGFNPAMANGSAAWDPAANGIPPHMMYGGAGGGMQQMPPMMLSPGDQAQIQMNQQMQQFMQMQMQFMQMMAGGANPSMGARPMSHMPMPSNPDMNPQRQSFLGDPMSFGMEPHHPSLDPRMRTMSMVQPSSESWIHPGPIGGYTPSIAPSERSNVGLPGRYRPVSQMPPPVSEDQGSVRDFPGARRASTMPNVLNAWDQPTIRPVGKTSSPPVPQPDSRGKPDNDDDDDDEKGWKAMKAKREKKRSMWRSKKIIDPDLGALIL
ncbi:hypothetical protein ACRALDRAFT_2042370 [Sodiomyces alcalophilus JCM 7366]|uniref:uncharacterized protein n=1 Tax=Sodiomyces alcalophilus JCM 7366 TaxID=591952 RepID=UPI0039B45E74